MSADDGICGDSIGESYNVGLRALLAQMAPSYGFTLATFTAVGLTAHAEGFASPQDIILFLIGAFAGYGVLVAIVAIVHVAVAPEIVSMVGWQMLHVVPVGLVFLGAFASGELINGPLAWLGSGAALTLGYLAGLALVLRRIKLRTGSRDS
ncbi:MAG: hypothetical protein EXQ74_07160 [Thermoleophilia bacterium]|nr:hypothetical protein [Thermoleophilia bacterium]